MQPIELLGTAIALIAVYLLLSLIATAFSELLVARLGLRGQVLLEAVEKIVGSAGAQALYRSPTIRPLHDGEAPTPKAAGLRKRLFGPDWARSPMKNGQLPSYIPPSDFAEAVLQLAFGPGWRGRTTQPRQLQQLLAANPDAPLAPALREELAHWIEQAEDPARELSARLVARFNAVNDRAVGWFRRRVNRALLIIGLTIAAATNADTMQMLSRLSVDAAARAHALTLAESLARDTGVAACSDPEQTDNPAARLRCLAGELPPILGWRGDPIFEHAWDGRRAAALGVMLWLGKLAGLLLTAGAISLGAPFWFDLLKKLVNVRSSVVAGRDAVVGRERPPAEHSAPPESPQKH